MQNEVRSLAPASIVIPVANEEGLQRLANDLANLPESEDGISDETHWYRKYVRLGKDKSAIEAERDLIKTEIIDPGMADGLVFGDDGKALRYSYTTRCDFEWQRAVADGKLDLEQLADYCRVKVTRSLIAGNTDDSESDIQSRLNVLRAGAPELMQRVEETLRAYEEAENAPEWEAAINALKCTFNNIGGQDAVEACKASVADATKKAAKKASKVSA